MIFVTTGTVGSDSIIRKIDEIAPKLNDNIFVTVGKGKYIPKNCKWVRYTTSIENYFKKADLIITHGGAGTLFTCMSFNKRIIAIPQSHTDDQTDIVNKLSGDGFIIKCEDLEDLERCIKDRKLLKIYSKPKCEIPTLIEEFLTK